MGWSTWWRFKVMRGCVVLEEQVNQEKRSVRYSLVIPVYNSETVVGETIDRIVAFFEAQGWDYELILVNDGSKDCSWDVLRAKALDNPHLLAINLLRNYGQHSAILCGLQNSTGDYVITLDDDLQNPPEEMIHLINSIRSPRGPQGCRLEN